MSIEIENNLSKKLEHCKTVCMEMGTLLVRAGIHGVLDACHLDLDEASFLSLLLHEKPSAVFYEEITYDPERFIRGTMMSHGWKESWEKDCESIWPTPDEIKAELRVELAKAENRIGLPRSLMVTYAIHGQHRICWLSAEWAEEISEKIDEIIEARHERAENARNQIAITLDSLIKEVANDPEFKAIRGRPKKLLFLQKKYGARIPPHPRGQITRPAQNCDYVDQHIAIVLIKADELAWSAENIE
ncbi:hypothetical protein [Azonexus sp.]|uniref:hypothetical protein n=1 Tax=Azonexus sp. TaxID=1872668 RepID=UPI0035B402F7